MTQHELVIEYIKEHGSILPAKMAGVVYKDVMFGSETSKRCRELRKKGILHSDGDGRFERFYLTGSKTYLHSPILRKKDFCCASHWLGKPHDPKCFQLKKPQEQKVSQPQSLF